GVPSHINLNAVPSCIYTHPEIACVGLSAEAAKAAGYHIKTGKCLMSANGKTVIENGERGFMKLVADKDTDVLLGAQLLCERATDLISELTFAVANGFTTEQMKRTMRPHPTFSEALSEALEALR
ncbi:MAG: dihydrolipoyl dehydrogenase, partial [Oscillospiraceae bacterium]